MDDQVLDEQAIRQRLETVSDLRSSVDTIGHHALALDAFADDELIKTFEMAKSQLPSLEMDLRSRLSKLSPGDPESRPDLTRLQDRLAETAAKIEMGVAPTQDFGETLELKTSPANLAAGGAMFVFGTGWNAFTTFHAVLMIGGMSRAFGWGALALLAFYAIFWTVGIGMWVGAFTSAAEETVTFEGNRLTVARTLGPIRRKKTHTIDVATPGRLGTVSVQTNSRQGSLPAKAIVLTDVNGRAVNIALATTDAKREGLLKTINGYLASRTGLD